MRLVIAAAGIAVVVCGLGVYVHFRIKAHEARGYVSLANSPGVNSVPGAGHTTNQYVKTQNLQNRLQAKQARKQATSDVPTITRPNFMGNPNAFAVNNNTNNANMDTSPLLHCPLKKVVVMFKPNPASCTVANLKIARKTGVTAEELACQGCSCPALKLAGYTAGELKSIGYTAIQLKKCGFTLGQLVEAGFNAADLKAAGYNAKQLANVGFTPGQLAEAGFNPTQIAQAGFTAAQLKAAGIQPANPNCSLTRLKQERANGMTATALRAQGCGLAALKAAGFTAAQLKAAGFTASQLKNAGFTAGQLKQAGFSALALKNAGFTNKQLAKAGFTPAQIQAAQGNPKLCNLVALKKDHLAGVSATQLRGEGCGLAALKAAGYTAAQLKAAGYSAKQLKAAGFNAAQLKAAGFSAAQLKKAGFTAAQLHRAGFSAAQLKAAGFNAAQLKKAGFTAAQLKSAGFTAKQLRGAGYTAKQLKHAGFSASQLKNAGFSAGQLKSAGFSAAQLKHAGFSAKQLRNAGYSAAQLKAAGYSPKQLLKAGFTKGDLLRAGFTPTQAGYGGSTPVKPTATVANTAEAAAPKNTSDASATMPSINSDSPEAKLEQIARAQQKEMNEQQRQDAIVRQQGAMTMQAQKLLAAWSNNSAQSYAEAPAAALATPAGDAGHGTNVKASGPVIKAGTVMFAVLDTSINSDEKSPIMATIVMGPLKGAKLLGHFTRVNKRVLLSFRLLNDPHYPHSITMNAVAIDPDTARTAIAGQVNNHYLLRYGTLFASAFLEGLSGAIESSGQTQNCFLGFCQTTNPTLNTGQQIAVGLGTVGQRYSQVLGKNFYRPPTIKVQGGTGIGILFMSDLTLPGAPLPAHTHSIMGLNINE